MRYLEEFGDKKSLSDDKDHLKKLDPYLRSRRLDAIDMTALQPFIRDRKSKDAVSNATVNRALEVVRRISEDSGPSSDADRALEAAPSEASARWSFDAQQNRRLDPQRPAGRTAARDRDGERDQAEGRGIDP